MASGPSVSSKISNKDPKYKHTDTHKCLKMRKDVELNIYFTQEFQDSFHAVISGL